MARCVQALDAGGHSSDPETTGDVVKLTAALRLGPFPLPPIWRETLLGLEFGSLLRHDIFRSPPESAHSRPVMLIPGFLTGDAQMGTLAWWLRRCGHRANTSGIRLNVDCSAAAMPRLEQRLEELVAREGEPATLIGQSRGGLFARVLAVRRPELVHSVVTLGSPHLEPLAVHPFVWVQGAAIAGLAALGVPGLASRHCRAGACCKDFRRDLRSPMPSGVHFVSIYSELDGIIDWRACLDPEAVHAQVRSTHCGMGVNAGVYEQLDTVLNAPLEHAGRRLRVVPAAA